ncbi:unnamed protein product [Coccothraustes coccothraustes]
MEAAQGSLGAVVLRRARAVPRPRGEEASGSPEEENSPPRSFLRSAPGTPRLALCGEQGYPRPCSFLLGSLFGCQVCIYLAHLDWCGAEGKTRQPRARQ